MIAICINSATNVIRECESKRFKIAGNVQLKFIDNVEQACEIRVLEKGLSFSAFLFHAINADIVAHTFDQSRVKILNVFLHKRNIFVKELLLESFVCCADDRYFFGSYNGKEVSERFPSPRCGLDDGVLLFGE